MVFEQLLMVFRRQGLSPIEGFGIPAIILAHVGDRFPPGPERYINGGIYTVDGEAMA